MWPSQNIWTLTEKRARLIFKGWVAFSQLSRFNNKFILFLKWKGLNEGQDGMKSEKTKNSKKEVNLWKKRDLILGNWFCDIRSHLIGKSFSLTSRFQKSINNSIEMKFQRKESEFFIGIFLHSLLTYIVVTF